MKPVVRTAVAAAVGAATMLGSAFAAVPLYRLFCQVTGFAGTTQRADGRDLPGKQALARGASRTITVRFDANTASGMDWRFRPEQVTQTLRIGERKIAFYKAVNPTRQTSYGQAAFNVSPDTVGKYFVKIECFCFREQTLKPGQSVDMPVLYYIDPKFLDDPEALKVEEITLSYTFFPAEPIAATTAAAADPPRRG